MDYACVKFGDLVSAVLVLSCGQTHKHIHTGSLTHTHYTNAAKRFTPATVVGVSNYRSDYVVFVPFTACFLFS